MGTPLVFGAPPANGQYITRPGAYAIFFNKKGELGLVKVDTGHYFLAGGGIEPGEDQETALLREVQEEAGLQAKVIRRLGQAAEHYLDREQNLYYKKIGHFYLVDILGPAPEGATEEDHTLLWMPAEEAMPLLYHDMYRWAVKQALQSAQRG